ncbi:hypothetical protein E0H75_24325 [Kribbella capetownensis]|uniref:Uncharacterized protein n=1 Tax=Kribbella capetownensis TaxID=1572659 RepID=A0A4R0JMG3_9ACTN|nr:sigma factor-like helix-turn-helix DNA-binding protein [Kribbella capetownensis]TCC47869.1 hypothetical protein E0H75_24325 [Kribbella capetownensis]
MRRRDEDEFTAVTMPRLRRTAYLMCGDWHRAEDAAQDALVSVYRHRLLVVRALAALPPSQRACVVLRHYADLSLAQTARSVSTTPASRSARTCCRQEAPGPGRWHRAGRSC